MSQDLAYKVSTNSRVIELEKELLKELEDLKHEVEDADLELGNKSKSLSSLGGLKDASFFKLERQMIINKLIETRQVKPVQIQADIMKEEATVALQPEYNQIGLPLLLHQFYLDKIEQMANLKYLYLLRFTRFCSRSQKVEAIYEDYQGTLKYVMSEYMDAIGRAKRLSCAHNAAVVGDLSRSLGSVNAEDIIIYLSWIICHLHSIKKINSFMKILQWMPISHAHLLNKEKILENSKVREDATHTNADASLIHPRGTSFQLMHYFSTLPNDSTSGIATSQSNNIAYDGFKIPSKHSGHISGLSSIEIGKLSLHLPRHETDLEDFKSELESLLQFFSLNELSVNQIQTIADEAEFYFHVAQGFKKRFDRQQMERCFPTYNTAVSEPKFGIEKWGVKWNCSYEQEANWISFRRIRPTSNIGRERNMAQLWHHNDIDELLRINSIFLNIGNSEIILESLKKHVKSMVNPPNYFPTKVTTNTSATQDTATLWHKLYNFFKDRCDNNDDSVSNTFEEDTIASHSTRGFSNSRTAASAVNYNNSKTESAGIHRRSRMESESTFESISATQLLGLDDEDDNIADSTNGAYLSYLLLRHLKIRDLRRSVLSDLNYFRSLERTLTIDDNNGLALSTNSQQANKKGLHSDHQNLSNIQQIFNTPADYKVSQSMFMEFSEVRNRDDYYSFEDGRVHVRDQNGYYILYDVAKKDLRKIEEELLLIGSYYIRKDKSLKHKIIPKGPGIKKHKRMSHQSTDNVDMVKDGHQFVDRFAVLLDLWYGEAIYQESKRQIIDCYMEVYNTIYDPNERRQVAKIVTNLINDRPNFDFTEDYFLRSYQASSAALNGRFKLIKTILSDQIDESREYIDKVSSDNKGDHGRSQRLIRKQLINVHGYRSTIKNMYLLEVHPALAVINRLTQALEHTLSEFLNHIKPASAQADLLVEIKLYEIALSEWTNMKSCGTSYSYRIERDLFSSSYVEDPRFIIELGHSNIKSKEFQTGHHSSSMRQKLAMDVWNRLLEIVLTRHRLIDAAWETEILTSIYRTQANELNKEEFHLFLRPIPFELADDHKEGQCKHGYASEDELANIALDRYLPSHLLLAIQELDEKHISTFNFRSKEGIVQLLNNNDMENLKTVLYAQVVHKNCLLAAILLNYVCCGLDECITSRETEHSERKSTTGSQYSFKLTAASQSSLTTKIEERYETFADLEAEKPIPFVSIQLHKLPLRDQMLREFSNKQAQVYNPIRNYEDIPTIKRGFVRVYFSKLVDVFQIYSLKAQIIAYFNSIRSLISSFPDIRSNIFILGSERTHTSSKERSYSLTGQVQKRSSSFLSEDGSKLFNLWYIPTYEEVIQMFKALPIKQSVQRLKDALKLVSTLHDICQYVIAFAKMGSSLTLSSVSKQSNTGIKANWGGIEGIVNELREVQVQIDMLENPEDPQAVTNLLDMRRNLIFQQLDVCLRYSARETLLALNKENSYVTIVNSLNAHRVQFQDSDQCSIFALSMVVPDPIDIRSELSQTVFPWKTFQSRFGIYPLSYHQWSNLGKYIENCFTRLSQDEIKIVNGEILEMSLLLQSAPAQVGNYKRQIKNIASDIDISFTDLTKDGATLRNMQTYLQIWTCMEELKNRFAEMSLNLQEITNTKTLKVFEKFYRREVILPVLKDATRDHNLLQEHERLLQITDTEKIDLPEIISDFELKYRQIQHILVAIECHMIVQMRKKVAKDHSFVLTEKVKIDHTLPNDLWQKEGTAETIIIDRPYLADDFVRCLSKNIKDSGDNIIISKTYLSDCLRKLDCKVMERERICYENYSSFYEGLLKHLRYLCHIREQEVKNLQSTVGQISEENFANAHFQLADKFYQLVLEITALRAKIADMRDYSLDQEQFIRKNIKNSFDNLVKNLYHSSTTLKSRFNDYRCHFYNDIQQNIQETRKKTIQKLKTVKDQSIISKDGYKKLDAILEKSQKFRELHKENIYLNQYLAKLRTMNEWKIAKDKLSFTKNEEQLKEKVNKMQKGNLQIKMKADEEITLLRQQLEALRKCIEHLEKDRESLQKKLAAEEYEKVQKTHVAQQQAQNRKQLELAKRENFLQLIDDLKTKDVLLQEVTGKFEKNQKEVAVVEAKGRKAVEHLQKKIAHERSLKLNAFHKVDDLQVQINEFEEKQYSLLNSSGRAQPLKDIKLKTRCFSAIPRGPGSSHIQTANNDRIKRMTRPKTCNARLRTSRSTREESIEGVEIQEL